MNRLFIAEKPDVAKHIAESLGIIKKTSTHYICKDNDQVTWAVGHLIKIVDPSEQNPLWAGNWKYETLPMLPQKFKTKPIERTKDRVKEIDQITKDLNPTSIVNACDAGREGELIFRRIYTYLNLLKYPIERIWLQSTTPASVAKAIKNIKPGKDYDNLATAAEQRAQADWLIGMNASRAATLSLHRPSTTKEESDKTWSIGRVQTPTLALIVDRDLDIKNHKTQSFWNIIAEFQTKNNSSFTGTWFDPKFKKDENQTEKTKDRIWTINEAKEIATRVSNKKAQINDSNTIEQKDPERPFDLTKLQRFANSHLKWKAAKTLEIAQELYETKKAITYPRTETEALPEDFPQEVTEILKKLSNQGYEKEVKITLPVEKSPIYKKLFDNKQISDHFAIIPTGVPLQNPTQAQAELYQIITTRFIAAFCPPCETQIKRRITTVENPTSDQFSSETKTIISPGWRALYGKKAGQTEGTPLPGENKEIAKVITVQTVEGKTKPASHYSEGTLLAVMGNISKTIDKKDIAKATEERGLGTTATRANIIETLKERQYIDVQGQALLATDKGTQLIQKLRERNLAELTSAELTGDWELRLKQMEKGKETPQSFHNDIEKHTRNIIEKLPPLNPILHYDATCPICNNTMRDDGKRIYCNKYVYKDKKSCWINIWRTTAGRVLTNAEINSLLTNDTTEQLDNFISKAGNKFSCKLHINRQEKKIEFVFPTNR